MKRSSQYTLKQVEPFQTEHQRKDVYELKTDPIGKTSVSDSKSEIIQQTKVYKRRWYILLVYCLLTFTQAAVWNTWGPIAASSEKAFGWNDSIMALLPNWGPIGFIPTAMFFSWLVDVKGLRSACLITAVLAAVGSAIRCITSEPPYVTWTVNIAQFLNGIGGPVAMGVAPVLSSIWFPPSQRTTATAVCTVSNYFGVAAPYLIGPYMLHESDAKVKFTSNSTANLTNLHNHTQLIEDNATANEEDNQEIHRIRNDIMFMNYVECGWCVAVMILVIAYFPNKPKIPPSTTASLKRLDFKAGFKGLIRNKMFWMVCITYGVSLGVLGLWQSILDVVLKPHHVTERQAGWIGFYSILAGNAVALVAAKFADVFSKHMKLFLIAMYVAATVCFLWFNLILTDLFPSSIGQIYASIIIGTLFLNAAPPLFFEMVCESTYPIAEGITNFALTLFFNVVGLIFLLIQMIPGIGTAWANWCLLASIVLAIPVLFAMDDNYHRLNIDEHTNTETTNQ